VSVSLSIEDQIVAAIRRIMHAVELHSRRLVEVVGLTGPQLVVLSAAARLKSAPVKTISKAVHLSQPTVTGILDRLEKRGLVERARDTGDRRAVNISVTSDGRELLDQAPSLLQDQFRRELGKLEQWEQTLILSTLQRIAMMMEAEDIEASPIFMTNSSEVEGVPDAAQ
jgi:DNA-binding MarR family transcriptional regulator